MLYLGWFFFLFGKIFEKKVSFHAAQYQTKNGVFLTPSSTFIPPKNRFLATLYLLNPSSWVLPNKLYYKNPQASI